MLKVEELISNHSSSSLNNLSHLEANQRFVLYNFTVHCITFYHDLITAISLNDNSINKQVYMKQQKSERRLKSSTNIYQSY